MSADADHLDASLVAALVEGRLAGAARHQAETHLAECAICRHEVAAVGEIWFSRPRSRVWRRPPVMAAAAAAILLLSLGVPWAVRDKPPGDQPALDRTNPTPIAGLSTVFPAPDAVLDERTSTPLRFAWHAPGTRGRFRLTLADEKGAIVWSLETGDTVATLPGDISLVPGQTYFWYVDGLGADGRSRTTGAHRFTVR